LITGLMVWPAPLHLSQRLIGNNIDNWIFYWNNWWLEQAIGEGHNWFYTPYLFYPHGANLIAHSNSFLNSLLAFLIKPLTDPVAAYNLVFLFGLWVGAVGMFLLVYEVTHCSSAALLAGFIFAFAPYHLTQLLAHAHLGSIHWWPFYALFLRRSLRGHRVMDTLCAGLCAALTLWSGLQLAVLLALWTASYVGWHLLRETASRTGRGRSCLRIVGIAGLVGIVASVLSAPMLLPVVRNWPRLAGEAAVFDEGMIQQTDLLAYLLPPTYHPLAGPYVVPFYERFVANKVSTPYLGYTVLVLALTSSFLGLTLQPETPNPKPGFWLLSTGFWIVLAAGPAPRINGVLYSQILLPYRFIGRLFPISAIRSPDRFNLLVVFSLAMSAGLGAAYLARRRRWLLIPLALLVLAEYLCIPLPMWELPPSTGGSRTAPSSLFFEQMAQEQTLYGIVDYPMGYTASKMWLYYQTLHGKPVVEGHISRYTLENYSFIASQPLLRAFYQAAERPVHLPADTFNSKTIPVSALGPALRSLETSGVRYILLHKPYLDAALEAQFQRVLPIVPVHEDPTLAVYDTARPLPACYDNFPVLLTPDVALARFDVQHTDGDPAWQVQILTILLAPHTSPLNCQIRLTGENGDVSASPLTLFGALPEGEDTWQAGDLELQAVTVPLPQELRPGTYHWTVTCPGSVSVDTAVYTAPETLRVYADGHTTYLRRSVNLCYGDAIRLSGYRWRTTGADLQITLLWKALEEPIADYKVFVHLLNVGGEIVRQYDAMPCNWLCPTSQWQAEETISDQAIIPLWGLPPGEYRLAVGLYSAETQERLPVRGPEGTLQPPAYFILPDAFLVSENCLQQTAQRATTQRPTPVCSLSHCLQEPTP